MDGVLFTQLNTVPGGVVTDPVKFTAAVGAPLQTTWLAGWLTSGVGFTVTVAVNGPPPQPPTGVIVKVTVIGILVGFVSEPLISPVPLAAIPVTIGLSRVQLNTVPGVVLVKAIVVIGLPEQVVCEDGVAALQGGLARIIEAPLTFAIFIKEAG